MISDELKQVIDQIKDQGKMRFLEAATEEQIALFEKENDIKLPTQYKEWLQYRDQLRNQRLFESGWDVRRFWVYQIRDDLDSCVSTVKNWIAENVN